jgi:hypothetical protein
MKIEIKAARNKDDSKLIPSNSDTIQPRKIIGMMF